MNQFNLYKLEVPTKWRSGYAGTPLVEIYFDCADCGGRECVIGGYMATAPGFYQIAVLDSPKGKALAMFCVECFDKRWKENECKAIALEVGLA